MRTTCQILNVFFSLFDWANVSLPALLRVSLWPPLLPMYASCAIQVRISFSRVTQSIPRRILFVAIHTTLAMFSETLFILYYRGTGERAFLPFLLIFLPAVAFWWFTITVLKIAQTGGILSIMEIFVLPATVFGLFLLLHYVPLFPLFAHTVSHCPGGMYNYER